jgi:hypothetical protein
MTHGKIIPRGGARRTIVKLPNMAQAYVPLEKITGYLLSEEYSGGKSGFFAAFGFNIEEPDILQDALLAHAKRHEVARFSETPHGIKYIIEGKVQAPDGRSPNLRSIWIVDSGKAAPQLVMAYPLEGGST